MDVHAKAKYIRMSPRKVRLVTNLIKGQTLDAARTQLSFLPKAAALPVLKALNSAAANAVNNFKLDETSLSIKAAMTDQGPSLKRWRARAMGRAAPILKRTCHITIVVTDGKDTVAKDLKKEEKPAVETKTAEAKAVKAAKTVKKTAAKKPAAKTEAVK
jgi:large subunit ribosomal protein L22